MGPAPHPVPRNARRLVVIQTRLDAAFVPRPERVIAEVGAALLQDVEADLRRHLVGHGIVAPRLAAAVLVATEPVPVRRPVTMPPCSARNWRQ
ncbi:MAG: hypothetical protein AB7W28_03015 [Armatimonadota bacterium]